MRPASVSPGSKWVPQPPPGEPARGCRSPPPRWSASTVNPPRRPIPAAATVFATANPVPIPAAVRTNISGSMTGEASQNAMTGASGTPAWSIAAISGMTPQEQNGESAPKRAASVTVRSGLPEKTRATSRSDPLAAAYAAIPTARARKGAMETSASRTKRTLGRSCAGLTTPRTRSAAKRASTTRSPAADRRRESGCRRAMNEARSRSAPKLLGRVGAPPAHAASTSRRPPTPAQHSSMR